MRFLKFVAFILRLATFASHPAATNTYKGRRGAGEIVTDKLGKLQRDDDKLQKLNKCSRSKKERDGGGQIVELQKIETTLAAERAKLLQAQTVCKNIEITFILKLELKQPF